MVRQFKIVALCGFISLVGQVCAHEPAVFVRYKKQLTAELAQIEDEICSTFSMTHIGWWMYKKSWKWGIEYDCDRATAMAQLAGKNLSPRFATLFKNMCKRLKLSGKLYHAKNYVDPQETDPSQKDPNLYYGVSDGHFAYIDEETIVNHGLSDAEVEATILHELTHIVMEYALTWFTIKQLIDKQTDESIKTHGQQIMRKLCHIHEKIADIFGGLAGGMSVVRGFISEYSRGNVAASDTHPATATRLAYMQTLLCDMSNDPYYSTGNGYGAALKEKLPGC